MTETNCEIVPVPTKVRVPVWPMRPAGRCPAPEKVPGPAPARGLHGGPAPGRRPFPFALFPGR